MANVSLRHLKKSFGRLTVFPDFSLEVEDGEFICLLGPSGSGKTTLIRLIAGLETLDEGEVWIGGKEVSGLEPRDRHIGMMFQGYALYPHMTVRQNLGYPLKVRHTDRAEIASQVETAAKLLGISHLLDRRIQQISGGEQQRVAIGRAIVQKPQLYLLDEPISNLDASLRESVRTELRRLQQTLRATMVMVTHDQLDALAVSDRIVVMDQGVLQQVGTPHELYDRPDNVFVAGFIGRQRMNFLHCRGEGEGRVSGDGFTVRLPEAAASLLPRGPAELTLGVRPEGLRVAEAGAEGALPAEVDSLHFQGDQVVGSMKVGGSTLHVAMNPGTKLEPGARVGLVIDPERLHVFDKETGARLEGRDSSREGSGTAEGRARPAI